MASTGGLTPIVQYWHSPDVPEEVAERAASFGRHNPNMRYRMFDEAAADRFIAERFTDREVRAFRACAVPSMQADYFSYCSGLSLGGIYSDVSFRCRSSLSALTETAGQGTLFRTDDQGIVIHGFFAFSEPGHLLLRLALEIATVNIEQQIAQAVNVVTGPWIFNGLLRVHQVGDKALSRPDDDPRVERLKRSFRQVISKRRRCVTDAFHGVRLDSADTNIWFDKPHSMAYKDSELDWVNWCRQEKPIFR